MVDPRRAKLQKKWGGKGPQVRKEEKSVPKPPADRKGIDRHTGKKRSGRKKRTRPGGR